MKINNITEINRAATLAASEALSKLIDSSVVIETLNFETRQASELFQVIDPGGPVFIADVPISGNFKGSAMISMSAGTAVQLSNLLLKREQGTSQTMTPEGEGALKELTNIVIGNYLKEFSHVTAETATLLHGITTTFVGSFTPLRRAIVQNLLPYENERGLLIEVVFKIKALALESIITFVFAGVEWTTSTPGPLLEKAAGGR